MNPRSTRIAPPINTLTTRQLQADIERRIRRNPAIGETIAAIKGGDDNALLELVHQARAGDADAGAIAIWALLPRLSAIIRHRMPVALWRRAADEYTALAYLTICDIRDNETAFMLADKLISRTRRRYERAVQADALAVAQVGDRPLHERREAPSTGAESVENQAIAARQLEALVNGKRNNSLVRADIALVLEMTDNDRTIPATQRMAVMRSRRRLQNWLDNAA